MEEVWPLSLRGILPQSKKPLPGGCNHLVGALLSNNDGKTNPMLTVTAEVQLTDEQMDQISLASAYRANLVIIKRGLGDRLPDDAQDVTEAIDLIDEAILKLTVYVNRQLGPLEG